MKNNIILWLSAVLIVFVLFYLKNIFSESYPVSGTIGIEGLKLTYKLDKEGYGNNHKIMLRSDNTDIVAYILVQSDSVIKLNFYKENFFYVTEFDRKITGKKFNYHLVINNRNNEYRIPPNGEISFVFYGKISKMLSLMYYLFLFTGIVLIVRSGLEYFNKNLFTKKLLVLAGVVWLTFIMIINPLNLSYKFEYINHVITPIQSLFPINYLVILILLIITLFLSFSKKLQNKPISLIFSIITLIFYLF